MLMGLLKNILLKRGVSAAEEMIGKAIRHGMTTVGGALMTQGLADASDVTALTGGAVAVGGVLLSVARIYLKKRL